jgi:hypothetical protein
MAGRNICAGPIEAGIDIPLDQLIAPAPGIIS